MSWIWIVAAILVLAAWAVWRVELYRYHHKKPPARHRRVPHREEN